MNSLTKTEQVNLNLIKDDMLFLLTVTKNRLRSGSSYHVAFLPYMGMIIDGCETWSNKVSALKTQALKFSKEEKQYYSELRSSIKLWETPFSDLFDLLEQKYHESDHHFSSVCKPIAKTLRLYDIFGSYVIDDAFCDNTILDMLFIPRFEYNHIDGEYIRRMAELSGKIIQSFGMAQASSLKTDNSICFRTKDFGGFVKSPIGNNYSAKFVLFSMLCAINFVLYGIDRYIIPEITTKLRLVYIQYYYILQQLPQVNSIFNTQFYLNNQWTDSKGVFRNCMAHYAIGVTMTQDEVVESDAFGGLTEKLFGIDWLSVKNSIVKELHQLSKQIEYYLGF